VLDPKPPGRLQIKLQIKPGPSVPIALLRDKPQRIRSSRDGYGGRPDAAWQRGASQCVHLRQGSDFTPSITNATVGGPSSRHRNT
jgi:hypothetical protein